MNVDSEYIQDVDQTIHDLHQEIANTGFGDMLHDEERNHKFYIALEQEINAIKKKGMPVHVLDIGTGTGLLALFAAKLGADTVTACERFRPMADCAEQIIQLNGYESKINLVKKSSFQMRIGHDMPQKANLLVTELLDTELIGEGCLRIYNHAHKYLLTDDAICIPSKARCFATLIETPLCAQWNRLKCIADYDGDILLKPPPQIETCRGLHMLHDLQMSRVPSWQIKFLSAPKVINEFDFSSKTKLPLRNQLDVAFQCNKTGRADIVCFWWDIDMDTAGTIKLSCAPNWARKMNNFEVVSWREHWMQAYYYLPRPMNILSENTDVLLICCHDEFSWWFDIRPNDREDLEQISRPFCSCLFHITHSRNRIGQMNDLSRVKRYLPFIENFIKRHDNAQVLTLGDSCLMGLLFGKFGAKKVYCHEPHCMSYDFMKMMKTTNNLREVSVIKHLEELKNPKEITHVFAEPFFHTAHLPWDNFQFVHLLAKIRKSLSPNVKVAPYSARIFAMPMYFTDLHKLHAPVGQVTGFDLTPFDIMVEKSKLKVVPKIEPHALWEYNGRGLCDVYPLIDIVFENTNENIHAQGCLSIQRGGVLNGIALWCDFSMDLEHKYVVSLGPINTGTDGRDIQWNMFTRQGVYFLPSPKLVDPELDSKVYYKVIYNPVSTTLDFQFNVVNEETD